MDLTYATLATPELRALCSATDPNGDYLDMRRADCIAVLCGWDSEVKETGFGWTVLDWYARREGTECPFRVRYLLRHLFAVLTAGAPYTVRHPE